MATSVERLTAWSPLKWNTAEVVIAAVIVAAVFLAEYGDVSCTQTINLEKAGGEGGIRTPGTALDRTTV